MHNALAQQLGPDLAKRALDEKDIEDLLKKVNLNDIMYFFNVFIRCLLSLVAVSKLFL